MRRERGLALITVMLLLLLIGASSSVLVQRGQTLNHHSKADRAELAAFHAAEGGLEHARHALAGDGEFAGGKVRVGEFDVESTVERADGGWRVRATARPGGATVSARLDASDGLPVMADWRHDR